MIIPTNFRRNRRAFTLVELLVATVVLVIILLMLVTMVNQTATIWRTSTAKVEQFRAARTAFESINRELGQATLNPYYDYAYNKRGYKIQYIRQSDLRFISGSCNDLYVQPTQSAKPLQSGPGHAVFFQAPLGFVSDDPETVDPSSNAATTNNPGGATKPYLYSEMDNLLNTWGYFTEYGSDYNYRPAFLNTASGSFVPPPERNRYRLMEFMVPSDRMTIYQHTSTSTNSDYNLHDWFTNFLQLPANPPPDPDPTRTVPVRPAHLLAENIIMLVINPQLSPQDQASIAAGMNSLAPSYSYDSTQSNPALTASSTDKIALETDPKNQLPPVVQITMVAIDEPSAARIEANPSLKSNMQGLLGVGTNGGRWFAASPIATAQSGNSVANYNQDLTGTNVVNGAPGLQPYLASQHIAYRTFTTNISLRAAKWSRD